MVRKFFYSLLARRHFWRYATFDEVAELYVSRMLRTAAIYLVNAFISIYLYQMGYSLMIIAFIWGVYFMLKAVVSLPVARIVAWIGPKHAILISNILYIPAMMLFALLPQIGTWILIPTFILQAISMTMYLIAYSVDFSKVKSLNHAGKEIAYMNIFEKITAGLSPLIGGFVAFFWGPQVVIMLSALLFLFAAAPLFKTGEPIRVNQRLTFRGFSWRLFLRHSLAQFSAGFDVFASGTVWTLYVAITIIGVTSTDNKVYAVTGILLSVIFVVAIIGSYTYGRLIDRRRGGELMKTATVANALTHMVRPFVQTPVVVAGLNAANELATTGYTLPYTRAVFDNADLSGARVTYMALVEILSSLGASIAAFTMGILLLFVSQATAFHSFFFITAAVVLLVLTARFPLYKK